MLNYNLQTPIFFTFYEDIYFHFVYFLADKFNKITLQLENYFSGAFFFPHFSEMLNK